jgi:nicotinate phosphoribosyltransferase
MPGSLLTDLYELNMASSYLRRGMTGTATFSLFIRQLPAGRAFLVAAGIGECLSWLEELCFERDELEYLSGLGFDDESIEAFGGLRFTGDVWAVPEGRVVFAGEPLAEVSAPIAEAQLPETFLLNKLTFNTAVASKAARCRLAAGTKVGLVEFGFRRTQGIEAAMGVARVSAMVGFGATSNVEACRLFGLTAAGTMAHSYVEAFPTEREAFRAFASDLPGAATFLVDTYDTAEGVGNAIEVTNELGIEARAGIRLDSGDLVASAFEARRLLDEAGLPSVRIFVSGGLDERDIARLIEAGAPIDAVGVGTRLGVSADAPYLDSAYKLVDYDGRPVMKLSVGKVTLPGAKQVFRAPGMRDVLGLRSEPAPGGSEPLLEHVMSQGLRLAAPATLESSRERFEHDLEQLPASLRDLDAPPGEGPEVSAALRALAEQATANARRAGGS